MKGARVELGLVLAAMVCFLAASKLRRDDAPAGLGPVDARAVRVVTWNLGGAGGAAGTALRDDHIAAVASTLRDLDFDLACVLEVENARQARTLADAVAADVRVLVSPYDRPLALFARRGGLAVRGAPGSSRARTRRPRLLVTWTSDTLGAEVVVAALHASPWSARARNDEIGGLVDALARVAGDAPHLLVGDLNLQAQTQGGQDVFSDDAHLDVETYGYATQSLIDTGRDAGATAQPDRRLDYVLATPDLAPVSVTVVRGRRRGDMDHDPLVVDLTATPQRR